MNPSLAAHQRAAALLAEHSAGRALSPAQWDEVRAVHPGFAAARTAPAASSSAAPTDAAPAAPASHAPLTEADQVRYSKLYGKDWRTLFRWVALGKEVGDPCPLHDPRAMPTWWSRHKKWRVPPEIEAAALEAARIPAPAPAMPAAAPAASSDPASGAAPAVSANGGDARSSQPAPPGPHLGKSIDLESFDPEEGDRLRELKQIQAAKFSELRAAFLAGADSTVLEGKYLKLSETIDKIETRVTERLKKRGLYILRADMDRDHAANAELLRQLDQSQERRVLERVASLTAEQRAEVVEAIRYTNRAKERILSRLDCLKGSDLLRELRDLDAA